MLNKLELKHINPISDYYKGLGNFKRLRENEIRFKEKKKIKNRRNTKGKR